MEDKKKCKNNKFNWKEKNTTNYQLSNIQVDAILELRSKLTAYGINELKLKFQNFQLILEYNKIIGSKKVLYKLITEELIKIKDKFLHQENENVDAVLNYNIEETIQKSL